MLYEREIGMVQRIRDEAALPNLWESPHEFMIQSYARWAANEYLDILCAASDRLPMYLSDREPPSSKELFDGLFATLEQCYKNERQLAFEIALDMLRYIEYELQDCFAENTDSIMRNRRLDG